MSEALCENPTCRSAVAIETLRSTPPADDVRVCPDCLSRFFETLRQLPVLYARCGELLQGERNRRMAPARGGLRQGIVLKDALVEARTEVLALAASWAAMVVDEARPPRRPRRDITTLVDFLLQYGDWLAVHPAIVDAMDEFAEVHALAQQVIDPVPNQIEVGHCDRPGCHQKVYAQLATAGPGDSLVRCSAGHSWQPHQWLALQRRVSRPQRHAVRRGEAVA
ncbi:hypothetical protein [Nocardia brasiliensis]|uniref:hypothetical protein n=1 Tax=Nocardia brasiliensis TaxID=37326 RepID=UPI003D8C4BC9